MIDQATPNVRYSLAARILHWLTVALVVVQFGIAWTMPDVTRGTLPVGLVGWHLSVGAAILAVTIVRVAWRAAHAPPAAPDDLAPALAILSRVTHWLLYALLIALPVLGWANANARGWPVRLFGMLPLPTIVHEGTPLGMQMGDVHGNVAILLLVVIGLHVTGASYHAIVLRDRTLRRML